LSQRDAAGWQLEGAPVQRPHAPLRVETQDQVAGHQQAQRRAKPTKATAAELPPGRQLERAQREQHAGQQQVAEPVGDHAHHHNLRRLGGGEAKTGIEPVAHCDTADQRAQVQIEGVGHEAHAHDARDRQAVAGQVASEQVVAAVQRIAGQRQCRRAEQRAQRVGSQRYPGPRPVDAARLVHEQHHHEHEEADHQPALDPRPAAVTGFGARGGPTPRGAGGGALSRHARLPWRGDCAAWLSLCRRLRHRRIAGAPVSVRGAAVDGPTAESA
jgi:hypothetical protein